MIDKYAEIRDRALLYNACKGILRVKMALDLSKMAPKAWAQTPDAIKPILSNTANGAKAVGDYVKNNPISTLVGGGTGFVAGGAGGERLANYIAKKLGLDPTKAGWRGRIGRFIGGAGKWTGRALGTVGGALLMSNAANSFNDRWDELVSKDKPAAPVAAPKPPATESVAPAAPKTAAYANVLANRMLNNF